MNINGYTSETNYIRMNSDNNTPCPTNECIICLDNTKSERLSHYSAFNNDCCCNYYIHKSCLIDWIRKNTQGGARCLLCMKTIMNSNEIASIDSRMTTEYHPRSQRVMRMQLYDIFETPRPTVIVDDVELHMPRDYERIIRQQQQQPQHPPNININVGDNNQSDEILNSDERRELFVNVTRTHRETTRNLIQCVCFIIFFIIVLWFALFLFT